MKKLILLTFTILSYTTGICQNNWTICSDQQDGWGYGTESIQEILVDGDTVFFVGSIIQTNNIGNMDIHWGKIDKNGEVIASKVFGGDLKDYGCNLTKLQSGNFLISGVYQNNDLLLIEIDSDGNIIRNNTISSSSTDNYSKALKTKEYDGVIYIYTRNYLHVLNSDLSINKSIKHDTQAGTYEDGNFVKCGDNIILTSVDGSFALKINLTSLETSYISFDFNGNTPNFYIIDIYKESESSFLLTGGTWDLGEGNEEVILCSVNTNGSLNWLKTYGTSSDDGFGSNIEIVNDTIYIKAFRTEQGDNGSGHKLIRTLTDGTLINDSQSDLYPNTSAAPEYGSNQFAVNESGFYSVFFGCLSKNDSRTLHSCEISNSFVENSYSVTSSYTQISSSIDESSLFIEQSVNLDFLDGEDVFSRYFCTGTCSNGQQDGDETGVDCGGSICPPCSGTTSIMEQTSSIPTYYPSPASNSITIENSSSLKIYDMMGRMVFNKQNLNQQETIDISSLSEGVYNIILDNKSDKLIIQK